MNKLIKEYNDVAINLKIKRKEFLWRWIIKAFRATSILNKNNNYYLITEKIKFLGVILIVLLDDLAENLQNRKLLLISNKIVSSELDYFIENGRLNNKYLLLSTKLSKNEKKYLYFIQKIIREILINIIKLPNYTFLKNEYYKYWIKVLYCFNFTYFTNNYIKSKNASCVENYIKSLKYSHYTEISGHNMHVVLAMIIDLMAIKNINKINKKELNLILKIAKEAQAMGRIDNWLSTWKREMLEKDFSSGISIYCINKKYIAINLIKKYIKNNDRNLSNQLIKLIEKSNFKKYFLNKWKSHQKKIIKLSKNIYLISTKKYIKGTNLFLKLHIDNQKKI